MIKSSIIVLAVLACSGCGGRGKVDEETKTALYAIVEENAIVEYGLREEITELERQLRVLPLPYDDSFEKPVDEYDITLPEKFYVKQVRNLKIGESGRFDYHCLRADWKNRIWLDIDADEENGGPVQVICKEDGYHIRIIYKGTQIKKLRPYQHISSDCVQIQNISHLNLNLVEPKPLEE